MHAATKFPSTSGLLSLHPEGRSSPAPGGLHNRVPDMELKFSKAQSLGRRKLVLVKCYFGKMYGLANVTAASVSENI